MNLFKQHSSSPKARTVNGVLSTQKRSLGIIPTPRIEPESNDFTATFLSAAEKHRYMQMKRQTTKTADEVAATTVERQT